MGNVKILNTTPHPIHIFNPEQVYYDEKRRKHFLKNKDEKPVVIIEPSGILLNVKTKYILQEVKGGIPIYIKLIEGIDPLPGEHDILIVSKTYANTALQFNLKGLERLYTVSQTVYTNKNNPRPIGCLGLNKIKI